jgi:hypothetical protein
VLNADLKGDVDVSFAVEGEARISNSCFGGKVDLSNSQFRSSLTFQNVEFQKSVQLNNSEFEGTFRLQDVALTGNNFSLRQCVFGGRAILSNSRKKENLFHEALVDLQGIQIDADHHVAIIDADLRKAKLVDADVRNIDFIGVRWPRMSRGALAANCDSVYDEICEEDEENPKWSKIEQLYRELKQSYEKAGDYYSAGHFHIGEKDTHLKTTERPLRRMMLQVYRSVSIYGERVVPAIFWLIGAVLTFGVLYLAAGLAPVNGNPYLFTGASPGRETWISLSNAVTYSLQVTAFSAPEGYEVIGADGRVLRVIQRSITTPLIALAALAIRQQMKR